MKRKMKSFRLKEDTIQKLKQCKAYYDKYEPDMKITQTDLVTWAISSMYWKMVDCGDIPEPKEGN